MTVGDGHGPDLMSASEQTARPPTRARHVEAEVARQYAHLTRDKLHRLVGQLRPATRKPPLPGEEPQQEGETQPGRAPLPGDKLALIVPQRPALDQLVNIQRHP